MTNPRKSTEELKKSGSYRKPRHGVPDEALPAAAIALPAGLDEHAAHVWRELIGFLPAGTLRPQDAYGFATLCRLVSRERRDPASFSAADHSVLLRWIGKFGLSPADRGRMPPAPRAQTEEERAAEKYFTVGRPR